MFSKSVKRGAQDVTSDYTSRWKQEGVCRLGKPLQVAQDISPRLAKAAVAARVAGTMRDLDYHIEEDSSLEIITVDSPEGLEILRHSAAHIMAEAVKRLYPGTRLAIGPTIENGFYYDFDAPETFSAEDLVRIEAEMEKIIEENQEFVHRKLEREDAIRVHKAGGRV